MLYVHEKLNIMPKRRKYIKDILKQVAEENIWKQEINKKRMEKSAYFKAVLQTGPLLEL
jgi:hypothetical protein